MLRSEAIARINRAIGFRPSGNSLETHIISCLKEAQRDLEKGKTLPKFLLREDQTLALLSGAHTVAKPADFLREFDEETMHYFATGSTIPVFLQRKMYVDAYVANLHASVDSDLTVEPVAPSVYVLRKSTIDFVTTANQNYTLYWSYFGAADVLDSEIENDWLEFAPEWLIGEAGSRLAPSLRDSNALAEFQSLAQKGRSAIFAEDIAADEAGGPFVMGRNN